MKDFPVTSGRPPQFVLEFFRNIRSRLVAGTASSSHFRPTDFPPAEYAGRRCWGLSARRCLARQGRIRKTSTRRCWSELATCCNPLTPSEKDLPASGPTCRPVARADVPLASHRSSDVQPDPLPPAFLVSWSRPRAQQRRTASSSGVRIPAL